MSEFLRMENITKRFGKVYANKDINLSVRRGEVHTLLGENGAGKSTLMNILSGLYQPTSGQIYLEGKKVEISSPRVAVKMGIGMVHQHFMLVEAMTVFENIILGVSKDRSLFIKEDQLKKEIQELADNYGLEVELDKLITDISVGAQQRVEILKALFRGAELLILDEPTAALDPIAESEIYQKYNEMTKGKSSVYISHRLASTRFCDRIILIESSAILEEGTHQQLMEQEGRYAELFAVQSKYYEKGEEGNEG